MGQVKVGRDRTDFGVERNGFQAFYVFKRNCLLPF